MYTCCRVTETYTVFRVYARQNIRVHHIDFSIPPITCFFPSRDCCAVLRQKQNACTKHKSRCTLHSIQKQNGTKQRKTNWSTNRAPNLNLRINNKHQHKNHNKDANKTATELKSICYLKTTSGRCANSKRCIEIRMIWCCNRIVCYWRKRRACVWSHRVLNVWFFFGAGLCVSELRNRLIATAIHIEISI